MIHFYLRTFLRPPRERRIVLVDRVLQGRLRPRPPPRMRPLPTLRRVLGGLLVLALCDGRLLLVLWPGEVLAQAHRAPKLITPW